MKRELGFTPAVHVRGLRRGRAALSPGTVRNCLSSATSELDAANRHEAVAIAQRLG